MHIYTISYFFPKNDKLFVQKNDYIKSNFFDNKQYLQSGFQYFISILSFLNRTKTFFVKKTITS